MRRLALLLVAFLAILLLPRPASSTAPPRTGSAGVSVTLAAGWHAIDVSRWPALDGPVTDPVTRLVAASGPLRVASTGCQVSTYAFPRTGAAIVVLEWRGTLAQAARWSARPRRFTPRTLPVRPHELECWSGAGGSAQFRDHGRMFGAYVLAGTRASVATVARARAVLDTLRVLPRPSR